MAEKRQAVWFVDGGHAWLQVHKKDLKTLGVQNQISAYSYQNRHGSAFLEEDSDASIYLTAAAAKGWEINTTYAPHVDVSPIRDYPTYQA